MTAMVMEKEAGLKQALRTMGMTDSAYWLSWSAWELTLSLVSANLICLFGECTESGHGDICGWVGWTVDG